MFAWLSKAFQTIIGKREREKESDLEHLSFYLTYMGFQNLSMISQDNVDSRRKLLSEKTQMNEKTVQSIEFMLEDFKISEVIPDKFKQTFKIGVAWSSKYEDGSLIGSNIRKKVFAGDIAIDKKIEEIDSNPKIYILLWFILASSFMIMKKNDGNGSQLLEDSIFQEGTSFGIFVHTDNDEIMNNLVKWSSKFDISKLISLLNDKEKDTIKERLKERFQTYETSSSGIWSRFFSYSYLQFENYKKGGALNTVSELEETLLEINGRFLELIQKYPISLEGNYKEFKMVESFMKEENLERDIEKINQNLKFKKPLYLPTSGKNVPGLKYVRFPVKDHPRFAIISENKEEIFDSKEESFKELRNYGNFDFNLETSDQLNSAIAFGILLGFGFDFFQAGFLMVYFNFFDTDNSNAFILRALVK